MVLLLGVTVLYDYIRNLSNLTFNITFYYDQGKCQDIPPIGLFFTSFCGSLFTSGSIWVVCTIFHCTFSTVIENPTCKMENASEGNDIMYKGITYMYAVVDLNLKCTRHTHNA